MLELVRWLSQGEPDLPEGAAFMTERERERLLSMRYAKRREEFRLGRWTAKGALATAAGLDGSVEDLRSIEVLHAFDGAPEPHRDGVAMPFPISMTDRAGWAVCVVGDPGGGGLGVDLELVEPRSDGFVADYFTADEQGTVGAAANRSGHDLLANLIWSAKESALKVLRTGLRRDTRSVEVRLGPGRDDEWTPLSVTDLVDGPEFPGWWVRFGSFLLTVAAREAIAPPESFVEPPGLATATPLHSWMQAPR